MYGSVGSRLRRQVCMPAFEQCIYGSSINVPFGRIDLSEPRPHAGPKIGRCKTEAVQRFHSRASNEGDAQRVLRDAQVDFDTITSPTLRLMDRDRESQAQRNLGSGARPLALRPPDSAGWDGDSARHRWQK